MGKASFQRKNNYFYAMAIEKLTLSEKNDESIKYVILSL